MKKYIIPILLSVLALYGVMRNSAYNVDSSSYFKYLEADSEHQQEFSRFSFCGLVWKLRENQSIPLYVNCGKKDWKISQDVEYKFGTSIFDLDKSYHNKIDAKFEYEYNRLHKYKIALKNLLFMKHDPGPLMEMDSDFYRTCMYKGKKITVYHKYRYGYHVSQGESIYIPEALQVKDCAAVKSNE